MTRFLLKRLALALVTLWVLSIIVFAAAQLLPGDIGRQVLGPFADEQSVKMLDHQLGVDRPVYTQYISWIGHLLHGNLGSSLQYKVPVWSLLGPSLVNSLELAAVAVVLVVPLSLLGGVDRGAPARTAHRPRDHAHRALADGGARSSSRRSS